MIYVLDTNALIFMIRGLKQAGKSRSAHARALRLANRCRKTQGQGHEIGLSAITAAELEYGARNSDRYDDEMAAVRKTLAPFNVYPFDDVHCPMHYGRIRHELEQAGMPIGAMDLLIAAHVLSLNAVLVTNNRSHFARVQGLQIEDWT